MPVSSNGSVYLNAGSIVNPTIGKPVYAMYSYYWGGLDAATGDPIGYLGKVVSTDWSSITSKTSLDSLKYNGPVQPTYFGALRNTFRLKKISFSFNISYKLGYAFRSQSVDIHHYSAIGLAIIIIPKDGKILVMKRKQMSPHYYTRQIIIEITSILIQKYLFKEVIIFDWKM